MTHDSIAPSPDYQQPAPKKPARGSRKAKNMARFEAQYDEDVHIGETIPFAHCLLTTQIGWRGQMGIRICLS